MEPDLSMEPARKLALPLVAMELALGSAPRAPGLARWDEEVEMWDKGAAPRMMQHSTRWRSTPRRA